MKIPEHPTLNREWDKKEIKKKTDKMLEDHGTKVLDLEWPALVTERFGK